ncbi:unnamed protein product [Bemisia tabaci]|uniref:Uncharacterized protein n=1 Tax=Bemisia tabaci TaxID=7038 RepID=A0A9N9ZZE0_BEMTA|nr:unnamed protein product [Bemisia tabaci]
MAQNMKNVSKLPIFSQIRRSISSTAAKCKELNALNAQAATEEIGHHTVVVTNFQKRLLVLAKKYSNISEVPERVSLDKVHRAQDLFRIRMATYSLGFVTIGALIMIISGKNAALRGDSVEHRSEEWHQDWEKKHAAEIAAKKAH